MTITPEQRHVLELLAAAGERGITEAALSALGCRVEGARAALRGTEGLHPAWWSWSRA